MTIGKYIDNGERFPRIDSWTSRASAHMVVPRAWQGTSTFFIKGEEKLDSPCGFHEASPEAFINDHDHFEKGFNGAIQNRQVPRSAVEGSGNGSFPTSSNSNGSDLTVCSNCHEFCSSPMDLYRSVFPERS